ncbi:MAG TPA: chromate efflux transporter [Polyangia bacterium]
MSDAPPPPPSSPSPSPPPPSPPSPPSPPPRRRALVEVALLFLRLGFTAFGGPAAHLALMEEAVVRRRQWVTREEFLDLVGATNLIPGPNSTELAIHLGHRRAGWAGLVVAGAAFIAPAMGIVLAFAWVYVRYGSLPAVAHLLIGVKPVIIAVVAQALWSLGRAAIKSPWLGVVAVAALAASVAGVHELVVLFAAGAVAALVPLVRARRPPGAPVVVWPWPLAGAGGATAAAAATAGLWTLFFFFLKVGSVLFGSGYVLLAFLRADLVERWHWLSDRQLLDAIAVGQVTPGPLFTTATFIGYVLGGTSGALLATLGIFLPAFVFVALSAPLLPRLRRSPIAGAILDGVNVASLALMANVTWLLARSAVTDGWTAALALVSLVLLVRFRINSVWLVAGGAALGLVLAA